MVTATALDLIKLSLKMSGVMAIGQTPQAEDANDVFTLLNSMLATWSQNRWLVYHLIDISHNSTGAQVYSVGTGGDFNVTRPDRLQFAYVRMNQASASPIDYPLTVIETQEEYSAIAIKKLVSFPSIAFYDATMPFGTLYIWPVPQSQFQIHILVKEPLTQFNALNDPITLPPEYYEALLYNLTGRVSLLYQLPVNPAIVALATGALNTVRVANHRVANLALPAGLSRGGGAVSSNVGGIQQGNFTLDQDVLGPV